MCKIVLFLKSWILYCSAHSLSLPIIWWSLHTFFTIIALILMWPTLGFDGVHSEMVIKTYLECFTCVSALCPASSSHIHTGLTRPGFSVQFLSHFSPVHYSFSVRGTDSTSTPLDIYTDFHFHVIVSIHFNECSSKKKNKQKKKQLHLL